MSGGLKVEKLPSSAIQTQEKNGPQPDVAERPGPGRQQPRARPGPRPPTCWQKRCALPPNSTLPAVWQALQILILCRPVRAGAACVGGGTRAGSRLCRGRRPRRRGPGPHPPAAPPRHLIIRRSIVERRGADLAAGWAAGGGVLGPAAAGLPGGAVRARSTGGGRIILVWRHPRGPRARGGPEAGQRLPRKPCVGARAAGGWTGRDAALNGAMCQRWLKSGFLQAGSKGRAQPRPHHHGASCGSNPWQQSGRGQGRPLQGRRAGPFPRASTGRSRASAGTRCSWLDARAAQPGLLQRTGCVQGCWSRSFGGLGGAAAPRGARRNAAPGGGA